MDGKHPRKYPPNNHQSNNCKTAQNRPLEIMDEQEGLAVQHALEAAYSSLSPSRDVEMNESAPTTVCIPILSLSGC